MNSWIDFIYVFLGGGIGSIFRFSMSSFFLKMNISLWKGTLIVNILGSILIIYMNSKITMGKSSSLFLKTGVLGGLTTFSTFSYEIFSAVKYGDYKLALAIFLLNIIFGVVVGIWIFR